MTTKTIYFDESGQTGEKLLDADQPFFSVGSTDLTQQEASALLAAHFPRYSGDELKFRKLFRRPSGRRALLSFARAVSQFEGRLFCYFADKRFAMLTKMVDWLIEPLMSDSGYDWYRGDYGLRFCNMFHYAFQICDREDLLAEVTGLYDALCTERSGSALRSLQTRYAVIAENGPEELKPFMRLAADGAQGFRRHYSLADFTDRNEIHVTCVVTSVSWWRARSDDDFEVVHDQSTHFFKRQGIWDLVTRTDAQEGEVWVGSKCLKFPLRVLSTAEGDSSALASLQVCDLIAGFVARARSPRLKAEEAAAVQGMVDAGFGSLDVNSITPGDDFVDGPPPLARGLDAVDLIRQLVRR